MCKGCTPMFTHQRCSLLVCLSTKAQERECLFLQPYLNNTILALRAIDHLTIIIKDTISRILIRTFLCIGEDLKSSLLGCSILPGLPNTIPYDVIRICRSSRIVLRQVPFLYDRAELFYISMAGRVSAIFDDLDRLLIILAALKPSIAKAAAAFRAEKIRRMISNRILDTWILTEVCCDRDIAAVRILLFGLFRINALPVPGFGL